ncbi:hypothetical protein PSY31_23380, partial [Shigella flexneri]|nr:hypothetical protein [Shigella flexneri]
VGLHLTQTRYTTDLLAKLQMENSRPVAYPMASGKRTNLHNGVPLSDPSTYRSVVGALQYLTITHPDISFAVNQVCQFMH